jgi:hypothetical protein
MYYYRWWIGKDEERSGPALEWGGRVGERTRNVWPWVINHEEPKSFKYGLGSFNDAFSSPYLFPLRTFHAKSTVSLFVHRFPSGAIVEWRIQWKQRGRKRTALFNALSRNLAQEVSTKNRTNRITGTKIDTGTRYFPNTKQGCCPLDRDV